jgi:hypothetical protein
LASATPFYFDWQFWAAVVAMLALVLSQLPPVFLWFRPKKIDVEVNSRIQVTHKVGNPNIGMYVSLNNTGGRVLKIRSSQVQIWRDGNILCSLPAQNYFETPSATAPVLFVPFILRPGESWGRVINFLNFFDRSTERFYRESEALLLSDIRKKIEAKSKDDVSLAVAEPDLVVPFETLFEKLFIWTPGEYAIELVVDADPGSASFSSKYRFTLFESDSAELRSYAEDYKSGGGISYYFNKHAGISVPLSRET